MTEIVRVVFLTVSTSNIDLILNELVVSPSFSFSSFHNITRTVNITQVVRMLVNSFTNDIIKGPGIFSLLLISSLCNIPVLLVRFSKEMEINRMCTYRDV